MTSVQRSWDEVVEVADRQPKARGSTGTTYVKTADRHSRVVPTDWYTPRGHALRALMHFYWQHPEVRGELADRRAIERLTLH